MPSSEEVLASPPARRRPVLRALVTVAVLGLVAWGGFTKLAEHGGPGVPAAAPPPPVGSSASPRRPVSIPPPPWVRYPTLLEGRWVGAGPPGPVTLVISNSRLTLWAGSDRRSERRSLGYRTITVSGHRVHVRPSGEEGEEETYRWRIRRDRLHFELVERTPRAALRLESVTFHRT